MSMSPFDNEAVENEHDQLTVQRTDFAPINKKDPPSAWRNFCNGVRNLFGFKSVELAERFADARVTKEEYANDATMLQAKADYELKMAEAEKLRSEARKNDAEAELTANRNLDSLVAELMKDHSKAEAEENLLEIITRIVLENGGRVEFDPDSTLKRSGFMSVVHSPKPDAEAIPPNYIKLKQSDQGSDEQ